MVLKLSLEPPLRIRMLDHVICAYPNEACGILAGVGDTIFEVMPMKNAAKSPTHFSFYPQEEIEVLYQIEAQGLEMIGIFHSHPAGPVGPSETDLAQAIEPLTAHLIWSLEHGDWQVHAYHIQQGEVRQIELSQPAK